MILSMMGSSSHPLRQGSQPLSAMVGQHIRRNGHALFSRKERAMTSAPLLLLIAGAVADDPKPPKDIGI
jgi:hypothetical protein